MAIPVLTVSSTRPRLLCKSTDKTALTARTDSTSAWKPLWDGAITSGANAYKAMAPATLATSVQQIHLRLLVPAFYGWIEETGRPANGYKDKAILAAAALCDVPDGSQPTGRRERCLALAWVFDLLYADMTTAERDKIATELVGAGGLCSQMGADPRERMDGYSGTDQMCSLVAALTVHGHGTFTAAAQAWIGKAMDFWYGLLGRVDFVRYQYADGAPDKGAWYYYQAMWGELWLFWQLANATDYDAWAADPSILNTWEWLCWTAWNGARNDFEALGDMSRTSSPHQLQRATYSILAQKQTGEKRSLLRWLYDQWDGLSSAYADNQIMDVIVMDRAAITAVAPSAASSPPATSRKFDPPGLFYFRAGGSGVWDYAGDTVFRISGRRRMKIGHDHLDVGSVQIRRGPETLLLAPAGYYDDFGGAHHRNAYQRTWLQSLAPCVLDPGQVFQRYGTTCADDGGQHFKKFLRNGVVESDPWDTDKLLNEGGGEAWLATERFANPASSATTAWVIVEARNAYKKFHTDPHRLTTCKLQYLLIKPTAGNGLPAPALLVFFRMAKVNADSRVVIPFHTPGDITLQSYGFTSLGYRAANSISSGGKLWVDIFGKAGYTLTKVSPGANDANGYGADQFKVLGVGTNYPPNEASNSRNQPDIARYHLFAERTTPLGTDDFVAFICATGSGDSEPVSGRTWLTDASYYGITLGTETYKFHKSAEVLVLPGGSTDTTPPGNVTGAAAAALDRALRVTWTDPGDADLKDIILEYRPQ